MAPLRLTKEEILERRELLRSNPQAVTLKITPCTKKGYAIAIKQWEQFNERMETDPTILPSIEDFKSYFHTMATENVGQINERLSLVSLEQYCVRLRTAGNRKYGWDMPTSMTDDVKDFMCGTMKRELKLSKELRRKPMACLTDVETLLEYLWCKDTQDYKSPLTPTTLAFYALLITFSASRPSAILMNTIYNDPNRCLQYKDLTFQLTKDPKGGPPIKSLTITYMHRKNQQEDEVPISITLWEDRQYPHLCPIMLFLVIAGEHNAFDCDAVEFLCPVLERDVLVVHFNKAVLNTPVLRSYDGVSPWSYESCHHAITDLARRAGYINSFTSYAIRRGCVNKLIETTSIEVIGLVMGHKRPSTTQKYYLNAHVGIDLQRSHRDEAPRTSNIEMLRGMSSTLFPEAPHSIRYTKLHQDLAQHPEVLAARKVYLKCRAKRASRAEIRAAKDRTSNKLRKLRKEAADKIRADWYKAETARLSRMEAPTVPEKEEARPWSFLTKSRLAVINLMYDSVEPTLEHEIRLLRSMQLLLVPEKRICPHLACINFRCTFKTYRGLFNHFYKAHKDLAFRE